MRTLISPRQDNEIADWARQLRHPAAIRTVRGLTALLAVLMAVASVVGLLGHDIYRDNTWSTAAFRGTDLVTLVLVVPVLLLSAHFAKGEADRATLVWCGALAYTVYGEALHLFGTAFNDLFLLYAATLALSLGALIWVAPRVLSAARKEPGRTARPVAAYLAVVGAMLGTWWVVESVRFVVTGDVPDVITKSGLHTSIVFGLDLTLVVPALLTAAVLLWRRRASGLAVGAALNVLTVLAMAAVAGAGWFQDRAGVQGASWAAAPYLELGLLSAVAAWLLLRQAHD